jgi:hypothetical protein
LVIKKLQNQKSRRRLQCKIDYSHFVSQKM